jgi:hypothetical protein
MKRDFDRCGCPMQEIFMNTIYCSYYDIGFMPCSNVINCPEEYFEDEDEDCDEC